MIRCVVFDFDGTLLDTNGMKRLCFDVVVARLLGGHALLREAQVLGEDRYAVFGQVARRLARDAAGSHELALRLVFTYSACAARGVRASAPRRGLVTTLRRLRRAGIDIHLSSATPRRDLVPLVRARSLGILLRHPRRTEHEAGNASRHPAAAAPYTAPGGRRGRRAR